MEDKLFKTYPFHHKGEIYEIKVFKDENGSWVMAYKNGEQALPHGYYCDAETDRKYKKMFGKTGWQRLLFCAKADIMGKKRFYVNPPALENTGDPGNGHSGGHGRRNKKQRRQPEEAAPDAGTAE